MCRMACAEPECPTNQCAMRVDNCCEYICSSNKLLESCETCPPVPPCPMPAISPGCQIIDATVDHCGCTTGRPTIDCSSHNIVSEGGSCGGFSMIRSICEDGLECVNTLGPMVADAPGTCMPICTTIRDQWGNCVDEGCNSWYDGCNTCDINNNNLENCSENMCVDKGVPGCKDIPNNCAVWYDGCNTCQVNNGVLGLCTLMYCFTENEAYCKSFTNNPLNIGDVCYRFCEDNSQTSINRRDQCPKGSSCISNNNLMGFDTCGDRSLRFNIL